MKKVSVEIRPCRRRQSRARRRKNHARQLAQAQTRQRPPRPTTSSSNSTCAARNSSKKSCAPRFPQIPLLGEEGISGDMNAEYRWVVDPIDGTVNYFFGLPHAAVSIALQKKVESRKSRAEGKKFATLDPRPSTFDTLLGVIYDPFTGELWTVIRGGKTKLNGKIVRVSTRSEIGDAVIAMGFSKSKENLDKSIPHLNRLARSRQKNPHPRFRRARTRLRRLRTARFIRRTPHQFVGRRGGRVDG
jgi:fructose-1,6-bisphosphatase/inositol monophosphatase family enzyme